MDWQGLVLLVIVATVGTIICWVLLTTVAAALELWMELRGSPGSSAPSAGEHRRARWYRRSRARG